MPPLKFGFVNGLSRHFAYADNARKLCHPSAFAPQKNAAQRCDEQNKRSEVVDCLLRSLNTPTLEIDKQWLSVAKKRLAEMRAGTVAPVPGEEVFEKIRKRFGQ